MVAAALTAIVSVIGFILLFKKNFEFLRLADLSLTRTTNNLNEFLNCMSDGIAITTYLYEHDINYDFEGRNLKYINKVLVEKILQKQIKHDPNLYRKENLIARVFNARCLTQIQENDERLVKKVPSGKNVFNFQKRDSIKKRSLCDILKSKMNTHEYYMLHPISIDADRSSTDWSSIANGNLNLFSIEVK